MNILEMHNVFRTIGQKVGLQTIRGILPESIDVYLNDAIIEMTREGLEKSVAITMQASGNTQASTMSFINAFRTLYRTSRYKVNESIVPGGGITSMLFKSYVSKTGFYTFYLPNLGCNRTINSNENLINPMLYLGFSVEYDENSKGNATPCRLMGLDNVNVILRDYCNRPSKEYPVAALDSNDKATISANPLQLTDEFLNIYTSTENLKIKYFNIQYLKVPNKVVYNDNIENAINCDLPEYLHYEIVERAVNKYLKSLLGEKQVAASSSRSNQ